MIRTRAKKARQETIAPDVYPTDMTTDELEDHGLHVDAASCKRCGRAIKPTDEVRKSSTGGVVHMAC